MFIIVACGCGIREEIKHTRYKVDHIEQKVCHLDTLFVSTSNKETELILETRAEQIARLERIEDRLQILESRLTDNETQIAKLSKKLGIATKPVVAESLIPESTIVAHYKIYDTAHLDMTRGDYELAITGFKKYLELFPDSDLADNAQYWIGECLYAQSKYEAAILEFEKVEKNYPKGNKVASSIYKTALSYIAIGNRDKGRECLDRLLKEYPNSNEAKLAEERLKTLQ